MRLFLEPSPFTAPTDNGIGRVLHAMGEHLPPMGVEFTADKNSADVVAFHAGTALGNRVDVLHCHGLYWSDVTHHEFTRSHNVANQRIIDAARRAKIITVPSNWVAEPFRRDMRIEPEVIGHGIDVAEWTAGQPNGGYILWNKNRPTDVCDPTPAFRLAERGFKVVSTFGQMGKIYPMLNVVGQVPFDQMKPLIEGADLYLATTPETFGIGTLEAMICGVPILGYSWCGTQDLVKHKETGWLVYPGDINGLVEGIEWLRQHRSEVGANAREFAKGFDWPSIARKYYNLYKKTMQPEVSGVSVVITNYNYGNWVNDAVASCLWQQVVPDEIIIVDDGSTDNSLKVLRPLAAEGKIRLIEQKNLGVAAARNNGITTARYPLIVCLDADDMIGAEFIGVLRHALEQDRGMGVAYTGVRFIREDGKDTGFNAYKPFSWEIQTKHAVPPPTCIPSGSMFRKAMWERCGGYKQKYAPGEDTEFWTHGLSLGFTAEMITPETMFWYRGHEGSASRTKKYVEINDNKPWIEDKVYPMGAPAYYVPAVRSYLNPVVSVIIPVGPGHERFLAEAIESVIGQTVRDWELIVVDDTELGMNKICKGRYPFIKVYRTPGYAGAGAARNIGIEAARGQFVLFLDADDWLDPHAIEKMLEAHSTSGNYVYSDFYGVENGEVVGGKNQYLTSYPYDREMFLREQVIHSVTALVPTEWAREVGGFDPKLPGWEEYDFFMKLAILGRCGTCVHEPLFYYQFDTGTRRKVSQSIAKKLNAGFAAKFKGVEMAGCCGNGGTAILEAKRALGLIPRDAPITADLPNEVRLEFTGPFTGPVAYTANGRTYYGANDGLHKYINAPREDVDKLVMTGKWRIIPPPEYARALPEESRSADDQRALIDTRQTEPKRGG